MSGSLIKFFASKKIGVAVALLALAAATGLHIVSFNVSKTLEALCLGFVGLLAGFTHAYSDDLKINKPIGKELLSKIFFVAYALFVLIFGAFVVRKCFPY